MMNAEELFLAALERKTPAERKAFLDEVCVQNPELREQVESLLRSHDAAGTFLDSPLFDGGETACETVLERAGSRIGPYKLLQRIGQGGMGVVYLAEQTEPVSRRVALKIIKPGMDSHQVIARFEAERQALAMMDHPNIAKVLDAGTTIHGRPYFVMELVNGIPITQFCDEQHLTARERLELFVPVCHAVQHAHQKGVIHRDLKPSNILVALYDGRPVPKVIDFGVAKATSQRLTEKTMFTGLGQIVGTLEYMSPEQAQRNQLDIDTRSDIYSLGVVLYELLTGDTPFDRKRLQSAALDELLRIIREEEPPKPSTRLSSSERLPTIAANRRIEPAKLGVLMRGDLDWIVMKTLEKDRARRYETASALAADLERFLHDEPVTACPPSPGYRFRKFARRNKPALTAAAAVLATLLAGIVGTSWQAVRATQEAERAFQAEELARQSYHSEKSARQEADQARVAETEQRKLAEQKTAEAEQNAAEAAAERDRAEVGFAEARQAVNEYFVQVSEDGALTAPDLVDLRQRLLQSAVTYYEKFLSERGDDPSLQLELAQTTLKIAQVRIDRGQKEEASAALRSTLVRFREILRANPAHLEARIGEATCLTRLSKFNDAIVLWESLLWEYPNHDRIMESTASTYNSLGVIAHRTGDRATAFRNYEKAREIGIRLAGKGSPNASRLYEIANAINNLALIGASDGALQHQNAVGLLEDAVKFQLQAHSLAPNDVRIATSLIVLCGNYARALERAGRNSEAADSLQRAIEVARSLSIRHPTVREYPADMVGLYRQLARLYVRTGRQREATLTVRRLRDELDGFPADTPDELFGLAEMYALMSTPVTEERGAEAWFTEQELAEWSDSAIATLQRSLERGFHNATLLQENAAFDSLRSRLDFQQLVQAIELAAQVAELQKKGNAADPQSVELAHARLRQLAASDPHALGFQAAIAQSMNALGTAQLNLGNRAEALRQFEEAGRIQQRLVQGHPDVPSYLIALAGTRRRIASLWWEDQRYLDAKNSWAETRNMLSLAREQCAEKQELSRALAVHEYEIASLLGEYGHWTLAHEHWEASRTYERIQPASWEGRLGALDALNDSPEQYAQRCQDLIERFSGNAFGSSPIWAAALRPDSGIPVSQWTELAEKVRIRYPGHGEGIAGRILLWTGKPNEAVAALADHSFAESARFLLAIGHSQLGQKQDAERIFQEEEETFQQAWGIWLTDRPDGGLRRFIDVAGWPTAWIHPQNNNWWEAVATSVARQQVWRTLHGRDPIDPWRHLLESKIYARMGEPEKSALAFERAVTITPEDPEAWLVRARFCEREGRLEQALADLRQAMELSRSAAKYVAELAAFHSRQGDTKLAEAMLRDAPDAPETQFALGCLLREQGRPEDAVELLAKYTEYLTDALGSEHDDTLHARFVLGNTQADAGQWNDACLTLEDLFNQSVRKFGADASEVHAIRNNLFDFYLSLPASLESEFQTHPERALAIARRMNGVDPLVWTSASSYCLGLLLIRDDRPSEALKYLKKARWLGGLTTGAHFLEAMAYQRLGEGIAAATSLSHGIGESVVHTPAPQYLKLMQEATSQLGKTWEGDRKVVLELADDYLNGEDLADFVWLRKGAINEELRRYERALDAYREAAKLSPGNSHAWAGQARALRGLQREAEIRPLILESIIEMDAALVVDNARAARLYDYAWHVARAVPEIWTSVAETAEFLEERTFDPEESHLQLEVTMVKAAWLLQEGDRAGYERVCQHAATSRRATNSRNQYLFARMGTLSDDSPVPVPELVQAAEFAVGQHRRSFLGFHEHTLALAFYRKGDYHEAIYWSEIACKKGWCPAANWLLQAMSHHQLGHRELAQRLAKRSEPWFYTIGFQGHPHDRAALTLLFREAQSLLAPDPAPAADDG